MADTIQVVLWALGQKCPLRQGADWENPATAIETLSDCRTYSRLRKREGRGFGIFARVRNMKRIVLTIAVFAAMLLGTLATPTTAHARWGRYGGYYGRPYYPYGR